MYEPLPADAGGGASSPADAALAEQQQPTAPQAKAKVVGSALTVPFEVAFHAPAAASRPGNAVAPAEGGGVGGQAGNAFHVVAGYDLSVVGMAREEAHAAESST